MNLEERINRLEERILMLELTREPQAFRITPEILRMRDHKNRVRLKDLAHHLATTTKALKPNLPHSLLRTLTRTRNPQTFKLEETVTIETDLDHALLTPSDASRL